MPLPTRGLRALGDGAAPSGSIDTAADRQLGFIHIVGHGFWSADYIRAHFETLERLIRSIRTETPQIRALVDLTDTPVQSADTVEQIRAATVRIYSPSDRIALVQKSALLAMQIRRMVDSDQFRIFSALDDAVQWLKIDLRSADCSTLP